MVIFKCQLTEKLQAVRSGAVYYLVVCMILAVVTAGCSGGAQRTPFPSNGDKTEKARPSPARGARPAERETDDRETRPTGRRPALRDTSGKGLAPGEEIPGVGAATDTARTETKEPDLIAEAGFDMIYPNFRKDTGRPDPFVPVTLTGGPLDVMKRNNPEKFRVIGTAQTPAGGQIAMIEVGNLVKVVREDDVLESGAVVKDISMYDVILEKDGKQIQLTMMTRKRIATLPEEAMYPKLPGLNINDLYRQYLEQKFGQEIEGEEGEGARPRSFNDFLQTREKDVRESEEE